GKLEKKAIMEKKPEKKESAKPVPGHTYVVQSGDTLRSIAEKAWGDAARWIEIYRANEGHLQRGGDVEPGQIILVP
ncbi:MAG TPA: hypothetical protein DCL44_09200, partial [Elusimicrobia bacterium]|nr:hypothetical protein [Elusimicrobiota bacterium]